MLAGSLALGAVGCGAMGTREPAPPQEPAQDPQQERGPRGREGGNRRERPERDAEGEEGAPTLEGVRRREEDFQGQKRAAYFQESTQDGAPLMMAIHGKGGGPNVMIDRYGVGAEVARLGWFGIYPETGGEMVIDHDGADHEFLAHLLRDVAARRPTQRRFALGFSGGAHKAYQLAARDSDTVDAIVVVSGKAADVDNAYDLWDPNVSKPGPVSILHVHGLQDENVPFDGGEYGHGKGTGRRSIGVQQGLDAWIRWYGAKPVESPARSEGLPREVKISRWEAPAGNAIELLVHSGMGHEYPHDWVNRHAFAFLASVPARR